MTRSRIFLIACVLAPLAACAGVQGEGKYPTSYNRALSDHDIYGKPKTILGNQDVLETLNVKNRNTADANANMNPYLWNAALDSVANKPKGSADPVTGTIVTAWYSSQSHQEKRAKATIHVTGSAFTPTNVAVSVKRQVQKNGVWTYNNSPDTETAVLKNAIMKRAIALRSQTAPAN